MRIDRKDNSPVYICDFCGMSSVVQDTAKIVAAPDNRTCICQACARLAIAITTNQASEAIASEAQGAAHA